MHLSVCRISSPQIDAIVFPAQLIFGFPTLLMFYNTVSLRKGPNKSWICFKCFCGRLGTDMVVIPTLLMTPQHGALITSTVATCGGCASLVLSVHSVCARARSVLCVNDAFAVFAMCEHNVWVRYCTCIRFACYSWCDTYVCVASLYFSS